MKQGLQLRLSQQLSMTPQLQQAIRLLQLSALQLKEEIQEALDSNMMLELDEDQDSAEINAEDRDEGGAEERELSENIEQIPAELPIDSSWSDVYESPGPHAAGGDDIPEIGARTSAPEGLREHLLWQMHLARFSPVDEAIATAIIDAVDDNGYLDEDLEDIRIGLSAEDIGLDEVEAVLHRVQTFDPAGVAARDTRESLLIQLRQLPEDTPYREPARELVQEYFDLLTRQDKNAIARRLGLTAEDVEEVVRLIRSLNPRPGTSVAPATNDYIIPDVIVTRQNDAWRVELNAETAPRLRINRMYAGLVQHAQKSETNTTLRNHLQEARWLLKSLQSRNETLIRVAQQIVERQSAFLEQGPEAMRPMVLRDIAEVLNLHESTVSRATAQKFMLTPQGVFELKYFFSSHVGSTEGGEISSTAIRAMIRKLIDEEPPGKPFSDNKIASLLETRGIAIARRTVAKYREAMTIPPSNERKRLM
ncbi:MAG: RNA polymerase factor sigma-54 [Pseudomonadota bacterium]